jgi:hypothetical protein
MHDDPLRREPQPAEQRRASARDARQRWAEEVTQALNEQRLSIHAAAKAIGISPGRLQAWLGQDVEPSPRVMGDLARVIGRRHIHLLQLLDWLPPELGDVPLRLEATEKLQEAMAEAQRWVEGATSSIGLRGGVLVASAVLESTASWQVSLRTASRGRTYSIPYAMLVAFLRTGAERGAAADTQVHRAEIESLVADTMLRASAEWLPPAELTDEDWAPRPDLVLSAPVLCASAPRGLQPNLTVPPSIVVVGLPLTGSQEVAALLAGMLDWAYFELESIGREQFGLGRNPPSEMTGRAQVEVAHRLLERPEGPGRLTVWSYSAVRPILQTFRDIHDDLPVVIFLRAPDSMLDYLTQRLGAEASPDVDLLETAQNVVRRTLLTKRDARTYLILDLPDLPDLPVGEAGLDEHLIFDAFVELAFQAAAWLHDSHGGPALGDTRSVLGDLWRKAGPGGAGNSQAPAPQPPAAETEDPGPNN